MFAYSKAIEADYESYILDKNLLKEMSNFSKLINTEEHEILISSELKQQTFTIKKEFIDKIKSIEQQTPESIHAKISGKLDVLKHTSSQLEIITENRRLHAFLSPSTKIENTVPFFGKEVTATGIANFKPSRELKSFEIESIKLSEPADEYFKQIPKALFSEVELQRLMRKQKYEGTVIDNLIGKWPGDESIEELLDSIQK